MTTKKSIEQLKSLIEHFNNGGNDFNATDIEAIQCLLKENQALKEIMSSLLNNNGYKFKNGNGEIMFELDSNVKQLERKIDKLKKQLEKKEDYINKLQASKDKLNKWNYEDTMKQKEFIKYLKDMLDNENDIFSVVRVKDVLNKYNEITGVLDEKEG